MSAPIKETARDGLTDLAAKIYMELICRNVVVTDSAAQAHAKRMASTGARPSPMATAKAPLKASPAPVVSTTFTL